MGRAGIEYIVQATEERLREITWDMDQDGPPGLGIWRNINVNEHVRVIVERLAARRYCTRSLIRSALIFETLEELEQVKGWVGRIYQVQGEEVQELYKSEDVGDKEFRRLYRAFGGTAHW